MGRESLEPAGADPLAATARFLGRTEVAADLDIGKLVWRGLAVQRVRLDATAGDNRLDIRQAAIGDALGTSLAAAGRIGRILPPEDFDLTVNAKSTAPAALARAFGLTPPPELDRLGDTAVDARLLSTANGLELTANSRAAGGTLDLSGTLGGVGGPDIAYNLKTRATWPKLTPLAEIFAPGAAASLARLDGLDLYAEVAGSNDVVSVSGLQGQMAGVAVNGEVTVDLAQARPVFDAKLQTGVLPAALFGGLAGGGGGEAGRPGGGRWSEAPLDLGWLAAADGTLALNAAAFETPDFRLENPALRATVKDRVLTLDQLDGGWAGGRVGMKGRLAGPAEGPAETALTLTVVDARPPSVPLAGGRATVEGGLLNLNLDLAAKGASQAALIADLSGGGRINLREGRVTGFDLASLSARLDNLDGPLDFLDLFGRASAGGATRIEAVDATLVAAGGTVRSDDVVANLEAAAVTGRFAAALPAWTLDSLFTLRLTRHPEAPPFTVAFVGPLDAPERRIDAGPLQGYIAARVAEAVARRAGAGALPEVLQNLPIPLPGAQRPPAQRPRPQQQPQPQPGEVFNDLLDSLLR
ncbi:MAG TPA: AsmA-like C-terminal region-containing protein [Alphaproteobacteria bacterium]|nr:AsmA-like C-terminal region-containing protein [Alphaproteobacteria bacterium]